ncbi:MAG: RNA-binding transcriptional accessory protein [Methanobrevibacter sp.]|uniref:RNA-binding transcriptional accessory protein n=1 Tax=Methanobrevibacter millerae TaxID=230361 RepID=A0A8T3VF78_9EURY|nr:Tex family protein [Methanobrevibacter sp.]MBE6509762.1 RNA-binding transcriptional accessory protein [Methanobrevibacter millerae]MBO5152518.1 RNA-binding transcriptional accessory protein [Methanobrevibacter sp.]
MITKTLQKELNISSWQVNRVIKLIDEGNTIPFIARYRKDVTGSLNDEILRKFDERLKYLRNLEDKKNKIIERIESLGKLSDELKKSILNAETLVELEDIYRPFKSKKNTRATIAKEKGLEPLAQIILKQDVEKPVIDIARDYINPEKDVLTAQDAIDGAKDIIAEIISDNSDFRKKIRQNTFHTGKIETKDKNKNLSSEYEIYYDYSEDLRKIPPHRILAINRAEKEGFIRAKVTVEIDDIIRYLSRHILKNKSKIPEKIEYNPHTTPIIKESIKDSYKRLISPAIEREIRNLLTKKAEEKSIKVFAQNLNQLLMESPLSGKTILGWDPAFRTGCKLAIIDRTGKVLDTALIYPTEPQNKIKESKKIVRDLIKKYDIDVIAIGNGTASRESAEIVADIIKNTSVEFIIVNEAGASVYSASKLADEEFPDFSEGERSAVSIARRLQDPLAELVKIDPKSIGVGQYQHDMNQKELSQSLNGVVEKVVNEVGVDLNTASYSLLNYVSGLNKTTSKNIIEYRDNNGSFNNREELLNVKKLGKKTYEQCAGFVKIDNPQNPLDNTTIHPESYDATIKLLKSLGYSLNDVGKNNLKLDDLNLEEISSKHDIGIETLKDIIKELKKPGRDPRDDMPKPKLRKNVLSIEDLEEGMVLEGTVRNIVDFGAFVDIGVHQDGLVHKSQLANKFVKHPLDIVSVGQIVDVKVLDVDIQRKRIQLSMLI